MKIAQQFMDAQRALIDHQGNFGTMESAEFTKEFTKLSKDLDNITGIVNRYTLVDKQGQDDFNVKMNQMMKSIHSINETTSVADALDLFVKRRQQMFIVTEEFGTTTGLITLEDAIETLLGVEIVDEHDNVVDMRKLAKAKMKLKNKV